MKTEYQEELTKVLQDCSNWDSESSALREAFDRGIEFGRKTK